MNTTDQLLIVLEFFTMIYLFAFYIQIAFAEVARDKIVIQNLTLDLQEYFNAMNAAEKEVERLNKILDDKIAAEWQEGSEKIKHGPDEPHASYDSRIYYKGFKA